MDAHLVATIRDYLADRDATQIAIFGPYACGDARPESDLDLLVEFRTPKSLLDLVGYELELEETIGRKIDLITKPSLSRYFRDEVLSYMQVIYDQETVDCPK